MRALAHPDPEAPAPAGGLAGEWPWAGRLDRALGIIPALILLAMMLLTFANVVMRYFFRNPISGAFEIMTYLMAILLFTALVLVAARAEHVRVGLLDGMLPRLVRHWRMVLFQLVMALLAGVLGWRLWLFGNRLARWNESTQMYGLPLDWLAWLMAVCCWLSAGLFVATAIYGAIRRDFVLRAES